VGEWLDGKDLKTKKWGLAGLGSIKQLKYGRRKSGGLNLENCLWERDRFF
jgi:lactate dehydrogenase-like 2-hydroxyacid dehydrogenase